MIQEPAPDPVPEPDAGEIDGGEQAKSTDSVPEAAGTLDETQTKPGETAPMAGWPAFGEPLNVGSAWDRAEHDEPDTVETHAESKGAADTVDSWSDRGSSYDSYEPISEPDASADRSASVETYVEPSDNESVIELPSSTPGEEGIPDVEAAPIEDPEIELDDAQPLPPLAPASGGDPVTRATSLINELQALLPALAGASTSASPADASGVADDLARAMEAHAPNTETLASLRAAVATAQARPRDVDVMLDFVGRAGAMSEVIAAFDNYSSAIDAAIKKLHGETEDEPTPRW